MPLTLSSLTLTFEQITYILLAASLAMSLILGIRLYLWQRRSLAKTAKQEEALNQLAILAEQASSASQQRFHQFEQALQGNALGMIDRMGQHHQELLKSTMTSSAASNDTLREFQAQLMGKLGHTTQDIGAIVKRFEWDLGEAQKNDFARLEAKIEAKLDSISQKVVADFDSNLKSTQQAFQDVVERLARIDAAQQKIDDLSRHVVSLQDVLTDKKARGTFGETQLSHILTTVFGEGSELYSEQHTLPNQRIADVMMHLPDPVGRVAVDSKFPLENYQRMMQRDDAASHEAQFRRDFKKHIDAIASRYIVPDYTSDQAILFLPAEAIFAEVHSRHQALVTYAQSRRVWIVSPTTFMAQLSTIQIVVRNLKRERYAHVIQQELTSLSVEFNRYKDRWTKLGQQLTTVSKSVNDLNITSDKITKRFERINEVNLPKIER